MLVTPPAHPACPAALCGSDSVRVGFIAKTAVPEMLACGDVLCQLGHRSAGYGRVRATSF